MASFWVSSSTALNNFTLNLDSRSKERQKLAEQAWEKCLQAAFGLSNQTNFEILMIIIKYPIPNCSTHKMVGIRVWLYLYAALCALHLNKMRLWCLSDAVAIKFSTEANDHSMHEKCTMYKCWQVFEYLVALLWTISL